jgi:glycolate oxidase
MCSIGGNVATNAGGLCCVKYGVTADYVLGMTVVLADGTAVDLGGRASRMWPGLSLTKLFVGSEVPLGVIPRGVLRLLPTPPLPAPLAASFATLTDATAAVLGITPDDASLDTGVHGSHDAQGGGGYEAYGA